MFTPVSAENVPGVHRFHEMVKMEIYVPSCRRRGGGGKLFLLYKRCLSKTLQRFLHGLTLILKSWETTLYLPRAPKVHHDNGMRLTLHSSVAAAGAGAVVILRLDIGESRTVTTLHFPMLGCSVRIWFRLILQTSRPAANEHALEISLMSVRKHSHRLLLWENMESKY